MAANDFAAQNGTEKLSTNALTTVNGVTVTADVIEVQRVKVGFGSDGALRDVDAANGLPVVQVSNSLVSTANSSAVALALNAVFTGTSEDISEYSTIMVTVFADQASAVDGLQLQQSSNGTNWDLADSYSIPINTGKAFSVGVQARFFRVVYTNGATANTVFRLQSLFSKADKKSSSVRPQDGRTNDNDFEEVLSYPMVYIAATNSWERARGTQANGSAVDVTRSALPTGASTETSLAGVRTDLGTDGTTPPAVLGTGTGVRGWLRSIYEKLTGTIAVTGAFFQATQPVSLATNTPILAAGTAIAGKFGIDQTTPHVTNLVTIQASTLAVTVTAAANTAATATLPAVAGQFHYITCIEIMRTSTAALAGTATLVVTTTNLSGGLAWSFGNAMAAGATQRDLMLAFESPLKSSVVNTATTVVMPLPGAAVLWRANVYYYTAA